MNIRVLYCKLHAALCTEARLDYMGSVTIDQDWMDAAALHEGQEVDVLNVDNGERLTTYVIAGERGQGDICLNGAAAHHFKAGNKVIIVAYCSVTLEENLSFQPKVLLFNQHPPFKFDSKAQKLKWLEQPPQYTLLEKETASMVYPFD
jgi:aspartate 1-decarboxylase